MADRQQSARPLTSSSLGPNIRCSLLPCPERRVLELALAPDGFQRVCSQKALLHQLSEGVFVNVRTTYFGLCRDGILLALGPDF